MSGVVACLQQEGESRVSVGDMGGLFVCACQLVDDQAESAEGSIDGGGLLESLALGLCNLLPLTPCIGRPGPP